VILQLFRIVALSQFRVAGEVSKEHRHLFALPDGENRAALCAMARFWRIVRFADWATHKRNLICSDGRLIVGGNQQKSFGHLHSRRQN
jgi:hypothetical protein